MRIGRRRRGRRKWRRYCRRSRAVSEGQLARAAPAVATGL